MTRSRSLFLSISLLVLLPLASGVLWSAVSSSRGDDGEDSLYKYLSIFSEVFSMVRSSYVDATDPDALLGGALEGVTDALDPFSNLVPEAALGDYERTQRLSLARSGLLLAHDHGIAFVAAVEAESPAAAAGFERGDVLSQVDGEETRGMPLWRIEEKLAVDPGREVKFRVLRQGETHDRALTTEAFAPRVPRVRDEDGIAVIELGRLTGDSEGQMRPLLEDLAQRGVAKLLIDLRGVGTGVIESAYDVGALFARGELGVLEARGTVRRQFRSDAEPVWRGDLAVLVDSGTLGAAEVLAAVLRDAVGAKLVGSPTFGWAGERTFLELTGGARLHLTTAFFAGPNGEPLSTSLEPDVEVDELSRTYGERERPLRELILERGLEWLRHGADSERAAA